MRLSSSGRPASVAVRAAGSMTSCADLDGRRRLARHAPQHRTDASVDLLRGERLDDVLVGAGVEEPDDLALVVARGADDDRYPADRSQHLQQIAAVDVGEAEVEQHDVGRVVDDRLERGETERRLGDAVTPRGERMDEGDPDAIVVLDDEHLRHAPVRVRDADPPLVPSITDLRPPCSSLGSPRAQRGNNQGVRRVLVMVGSWILGVIASVAVAFAAVGQVANRVAPTSGERLSSGAIERALGSPPSTGSGTTRTTTTSSAPSSTDRGASTTTSTSPPGSIVTSAPTTTRPASPTTTSATTPPPTTPPPPTTTVAPRDTATTSQGGTIWTHCSGAEHIVFVAAVPKSGFERTHDVEQPGGIHEWFASDTHLSKIDAECSDGVVHAEVEEERGD